MYTLGSESGLCLYGIRLQMLVVLPLSNNLIAHAGACRHCGIASFKGVGAGC